MIITIFGKSIKLGNNPNQIDMFATAGTEKEFAPGDKRRLEVTNGGKLRWKNADEEKKEEPIKQNSMLAELAKIKISNKPEDVVKRMTLHDLEQFINTVDKAHTYDSNKDVYNEAKKRLAKLKGEKDQIINLMSDYEVVPPKLARPSADDILLPSDSRTRKEDYHKRFQAEDVKFEEIKKPKGKKAKITIKGIKKEEPVKKEPWETTRSEFLKQIHIKKYREVSVPYDLYELSHNGTVIIRGLDVTQKDSLLNNDILTFAALDSDGLGLKDEDFRRGVISLLPDKFSTYKIHKNSVLQALSEGKPVPPEVLKDYPELVDEYGYGKKSKVLIIGKNDKIISRGKLTNDSELKNYVGEDYANKLLGQEPKEDDGWVYLEKQGETFKATNNAEPIKAEEVSNDKILDTKFVHHSWYRNTKSGPYKTKREALDEMAKSNDFVLDKKPSKTQSNNLMDDINYDDILRYTGKEKGTYRLSEVEKKYFLERSEYYKKQREAERTNKPATKSIFKNLFKAFGKQISMFGAQPYAKEGQTKEGRGGTLKLTRDSSGKGAHWKLVNKQNTNDNSLKANQTAKEENKTGGKIISPTNAFDLLQDKIGNSVLLQDNEGNLLGEGALQLVNENSEGNYSLFVKEANGFDSLIPIPKNQAVIQKEDGINFKFADKNIVISTEQKSKIASKPVEIQKAEENAKHARNLEKMRNYNDWQKKADNYANIANGQKDWFFGDLENAADAEDINFSVRDRIIKKADTLFKEIKRGATKADKPEIYSALIGAVEVKSIAKAKAVISQLKKKGYEITVNEFDKGIDDVKDKENFFTRVKISKGENDPLPKELQFATGEYAKAFDECAKKPNPLRETEMSLGLKIAAEAVPEFNTIKKQLFNKAGEGVGQLWVTGGLPGSGKSSTLGGEFYKNKVLIDPDSIKYMIAEERGITKEQVNKKPWELHEESSNIAKHLVREAIREKKDVIYDVTMKGTENLNDLLYMVNSDTFQANAEFIHLPIEKGIERDKVRGERGGRSIGADLYKKLFGDYPTHKAFFQLKDSFDNFRVYDNSAPLGEGAKLFYVKNDGQEKILHPDIHDEFKKFGLKQMGKSLHLKYQMKKLIKSLETEFPSSESDQPGQGGENLQELPTSEKIKLFLNFSEQGIERDIDPEQDFVGLGMLKMHGLIDENMNLTPEGEQKYQEQFGNKFNNMNGEESDLEQVINPTKNIAEGNNGEKKSTIKAFGKKFNKREQ